MKLYVQDAWDAGYCSRGLRAFAKRHNLDWEDFLQNGIEEEIIAALDDHMGNKVIEVAHGRLKVSNHRI